MYMCLFPNCRSRGVLLGERGVGSWLEGALKVESESNTMRHKTSRPNMTRTVTK
jgi:hypothetical protein